MDAGWEAAEAAFVAAPLAVACLPLLAGSLCVTPAPMVAWGTTK